MSNTDKICVADLIDVLIDLLMTIVLITCATRRLDIPCWDRNELVILCDCSTISFRV